MGENYKNLFLERDRERETETETLYVPSHWSDWRTDVVSNLACL